MLYSVDRKSCIILAFTLSKTALALPNLLFYVNGTLINNSTSVSSATTLTTSSIASALSSSSRVYTNSSVVISTYSTASQTGAASPIISQSSSISSSSSQVRNSASTGSFSSTQSSLSTSTLPVSTSSSVNSSSVAVTSSAAPINQQPVISTLTTVVSGTTQLVPVIIGGAYTVPVPVVTTAAPLSLIPTGSVASSSASALSSKLVVGIIPIINIWTNNPAQEKADDATNAIKGILPEAENLLKSLGGDKGSSPCSGSTKRNLILIAKGLIPDPFKVASDIIHSVACITNGLTKITGEIGAGEKAIKGVLADVKDLTALTTNLDQEEKGDDDDDDDDDDDNSTSKTSNSQSSSSTSCTQSSVTQDIFVKCFPTTVTSGTSQLQVTQTCTTSTSTVSGCSITAFTTTSITTGSANIATNVATLSPDPEFTGTIDIAYLSSRLAGIEASGVNGNATGAGTIVVNSTSSASKASASSSQVSVSNSGQAASPSSSSSAKAIIITSTTSPPQAIATLAPPAPTRPPYQTGTCSLHIYEGAWDAKTAIDMTAEIKDGGGKSLATTKYSPKWGGTVTLPMSDSKLPYDVVIAFTTSSKSYKRSLHRRTNQGPAPPIPPNFGYEKFLVKISAGSMSVDSIQTDNTKMPYMNVGGWDNNGAPPNRQMDVYWSC